MPTTKHYLNNKLVNPRNWQDLEVLVNWEAREDFAVSFNQVELVNADAKIIQDHVNAGNIFEGLPYRIDIGTQSFNAYADLANQYETLGPCNVVFGLNKEQGKDWLNDVADGFTFRYLYNQGIIKKSDAVAVPYVINFVPERAELLILILSTYTITKELRQNIKELTDLTGDLQDAITPIIGAGVTGPTIAANIGGIISLAIKTAAKLVYVVLMAVTLLNLIKQLVAQLFPLKRYHYGLSLKTMFTRACEHLNLTFNSSLLDSLEGYIILPQQDKKGSLIASNITNPCPIGGGPLDTFGDLIRTAKDIFNADYRIVDNVFEFERRDYWQGRSGYIIPAVFGDQDGRNNPYKLNTSELISNYVISFVYDTQDQNTLEEGTGRIFQAIHELKAVNNPNFVKLQGLKDVALPIALGTKKTKLTLVEETLKAFLRLADLLTAVFNVGRPSGAITGRLGTLSLSSHTTTAPKLLNVVNGKLSEQPNALTLWNNYHYIESFADVNGVNNQRVIYEEVRVPFCLQNFVSLIGNNFAQTQDGRNAEIMQLKWVVESDTATITYKVEQTYTNKLRIKIL